MKQNMMPNICHIRNVDNDKLYHSIVSSVLDVINIFSAPKGSETNASFIMNNLWLGNWQSAHDSEFIKSNNICKIVNLTVEIPNKFPYIKYKNFRMRDENACQENLFGMMVEGAKLINNALSKNKTILIHCKRGHHRSASIIVLYFMIYHNMSLIDALIIVKQIRPTAFRRLSCMLKELISYENRRIMGYFM